MKRIALISIVVILAFSASQALAQDDDDNFYDEIKKYAESELEDVAKPLVEAFGTGVCGGLYHTGKTHGTLGFDVGVRSMMVFIPEGKSEILDSSDVSFFPVPVIQASVGLPMDFEVTARGFGVKFEDETISLIGVGVKKGFGSYIPIPGFPDVSAMVAYHLFAAGDVLHSRHLSFDVMVSKSFLVISPYGGFGYDIHSMNFEYTYIDPDLPAGQNELSIDKTIKANTTRLTLGLKLTPLPFVNIFADYNISKFSQLTVGLAISFR